MVDSLCYVNLLHKWGKIDVFNLSRKNKMQEMQSVAHGRNWQSASEQLPCSCWRKHLQRGSTLFPQICPETFYSNGKIWIRLKYSFTFLTQKLKLLNIISNFVIVYYDYLLIKISCLYELSPSKNTFFDKCGIIKELNTKNVEALTQD